MTTHIKPGSPILLVSFLVQAERETSFPDLPKITGDDRVSFFDAVDFAKDPGQAFISNLESWAKDNAEAQFVFFLAHGNETGLGLPDKKLLAFERLFEVLTDVVKLIPGLSGKGARDAEILDLNEEGQHLDLVLLSCRASAAAADFNKMSSLGLSIPFGGVVGFAEKLSMSDVEKVFEYFMNLVPKARFDFREIYVKWLVSNVSRSKPRGFILDADSGLLKAFGR